MEPRGGEFLESGSVSVRPGITEKNSGDGAVLELTVCEFFQDGKQGVVCLAVLAVKQFAGWGGI